MQKKADQKINEIIESEQKRRKLQKIHFCKRILNNLNEIKTILHRIQRIIEDFANDQSDEILNGYRLFVLLNDFAIRNRLIPQILNANELLVFLLYDMTIYEELQGVDSFSGPSFVMQEEYRSGNKFGGLEDESSRISKISAIDSHLEQIEDLSNKIKAEIESTEQA
jgi:hypothetical protein